MTTPTLNEVAELIAPLNQKRDDDLAALEKRYEDAVAAARKVRDDATNEINATHRYLTSGLSTAYGAERSRIYKTHSDAITEVAGEEAEVW